MKQWFVLKQYYLHYTYGFDTCVYRIHITKTDTRCLPINFSTLHSSLTPSLTCDDSKSVIVIVIMGLFIIYGSGPLHEWKTEKPNAMLANDIGDDDDGKCQEYNRKCVWWHLCTCLATILAAEIFGIGWFCFCCQMLFISSSCPLLFYCCDQNLNVKNRMTAAVAATATVTATTATSTTANEKITKIIDQTKSI